MIERPGKPLALVEIKSTDKLAERDFLVLKRFQSDFKDAEFYLLSRDPTAQLSVGIQAICWNDAVATL